MKISYLKAGPLLDYWVGKAQGLRVEIVARRGAGSEMCVIENGEAFSPSASWTQGGPIIDREKIDLAHDFGCWMGTHGRRDDYSRPDVSPLVAAMRAYLMWEYGCSGAAGDRGAPGHQFGLQRAIGAGCRAPSQRRRAAAAGGPDAARSRTASIWTLTRRAAATLECYGSWPPALIAYLARL